MKEYFTAIIAVVALGSLVISLAPSSNYSKQLRLLCGLCSVGCVIFPILSLAVDFDAQSQEFSALFEYRGGEKQYYDEIYNSTVDFADIKNAEKSLKSKIIKELGINNDNFDVRVYVKNNSVEKYIEKVELVIYPEGVEIDPHAVKKYLGELFGCEIDVVYDF